MSAARPSAIQRSKNSRRSVSDRKGAKPVRIKPCSCAIFATRFSASLIRLEYYTAAPGWRAQDHDYAKRKEGLLDTRRKSRPGCSLVKRETVQRSHISSPACPLLRNRRRIYIQQRCEFLRSDMILAFERRMIMPKVFEVTTA